MTLKYLFGAYIACFSVGVLATPVIESLRLAEDASELVVTGKSFGAGPRVELFERFEGAAAAPGMPVTIDSPQIGEWTSTNKYYPAKYAAFPRAGSYSAEMFSPEVRVAHITTKKFAPTQEVFMSYWVRLAPDTLFPGDLVSGPRTFADDSSWKFTWLMDEDTTGKNADICLPTHTGRGIFQLAGNSNNLSKISNTWWSWDNWMRISVWIKANPVNPLNPGTVTFQAISADKGYTFEAFSVPIFPDNGDPTKEFKHLSVPGWIRGGGTASNARVYYDDFYLATGANAVARVELGRAGEYSKNTSLELIPAESWTNGEIRIKLPEADRKAILSQFVYVTDGNGVVNSMGFPLSSPPSPVSDVTIK